MKNPEIEALELRYVEAAGELRSKQVQLANHAVELHTFIEIRDSLKAHPDFFGELPKTYFSDGDLDPDGQNESDANPTKSDSKLPEAFTDLLSNVLRPGTDRPRS